MTHVVTDSVFRDCDRIAEELPIREAEQNHTPQENGKCRKHGLVRKQAQCLGNEKLLAPRV